MYEIRFIDTFAFMASSIEKLSENLRIESALNLVLMLILKMKNRHMKL